MNGYNEKVKAHFLKTHPEAHWEIEKERRKLQPGRCGKQEGFGGCNKQELVRFNRCFRCTF